MASIAIQREAGIETIPHVTPRDTTVMGLEGVLLGAHAEGVRNILAVTGDPPHVGDYPGSRGVYEIDSIGLVQLISRLNQGEDYVGKAIDQPTSFFIGVAVNPSADDLGSRARALRAQARRGCTVRDDAGAVRLSTARATSSSALGGTSPIPLLARRVAAAQSCDGAAPAQRGARHRRARASARCAAATPARTRRRSGWRWPRSSSRRCARRVAGVYVIPPFKQPEAALDLLT